jgi:hypothetical protein
MKIVLYTKVKPKREVIMQEEQFQSRIYCANCFHCKLLSEVKNSSILRIRCAAGKWRKKLGQEKLYRYCTIARRFSEVCEAYDEMGESSDFIRELRRTMMVEETAEEAS